MAYFSKNYFAHYLIKDHISDIFRPVLSARWEKQNFQTLGNCDKNLKTKDVDLYN